MIATRNLDIGFSALIALLGLYVTWQGIDYGVSDAGVPGAGYFPLLGGIGMLIFAVLNLIRQIRGRGLHGFVEMAEIGRVALVSLALGGFVLLSGLIGMLAATFPFMMAVGAIFGARSGRALGILALVSAGMTLVNWLIFSLMLGVPLL